MIPFSLFWNKNFDTRNFLDPRADFERRREEAFKTALGSENLGVGVGQLFFRRGETCKNQ